MAGNEQRRQKKLAAKKAKRKEQQQVIARAQSSGVAAGMVAASQWSVAQARVSPTLWKQGIGYVVLVRRGPGGLAAMAMFLVDAFCLGVKDVIARVAPDYLIADIVARVGEEKIGWVDVSPEHVRKLVEGALGYALSLGLAPHSDCTAAMPIFGDLDSSQCTTEFTFGDKGKPHFIAGPYDNHARIRDVLTTLRRTCGPGGFHYTVPLDASELIDVLDGIDGQMIDLDNVEDEPTRRLPHEVDVSQ